MAVWPLVQCPHCHSTEVIKTANQQEVNNSAHNLDCPTSDLHLAPILRSNATVKQQINEADAPMGSGVRDIARVLRTLTPMTVIQG